MDWKNVRILIVDDETDLINLLVQRFTRKGAKVAGASSSEEAIAELAKSSFDIGIFDINLPGMNGIELLRSTKTQYPDVEIIMLTGHGTVDTAIEAMKLGACDYLKKPYALSELEIIIAKALEKKTLKEANTGLKQALLSNSNQFTIIGQSQIMKDLMELTRRVADSDIPVLIEGESGTGKELIAKALHFWSSRKEQPFIAINSGALPETLLESELFGHAKGAFTGAVSDKKGLVEVADHGTLFLDEIGEMPLALQVKLLRFLESQEFRRVGDSSLRKVNVRVVAATNRILEEEVAKGNFREDLYYRLNVMKLPVPPLRERLDDVPMLVEFFLDKFGRNKNITVTREAMEALCSYHFPGNVRELAHMIERGILLANGREIEPRDLLIPGGAATRRGEDLMQAQAEPENFISLSELEQKYILRVLKACKGNKTQAAKLLGISVRNLYRKLEEYRITELQNRP
ncbi:sigma-54-dependent transcriptional regulator [Effusibacillus lacus]|uniref:Sigma-54-dependent Fis family transcriptional regulator n=1 Tax=Effusibacillus lacus TaxID=1348429 RepID=A0A292YDM9_9BACL|nr:sigma-54 dependent transcriptional regulator [Effusibacillus lacus]TCS72077.1 two component Fis family sigma54 specific transcriptional regulator [Effusibacillus lacus]GAX90362.1 sigma-54-dependent Fis family transcriptional regulator [Effusibacillus lacus]